MTTSDAEGGSGKPRKQTKTIRVVAAVIQDRDRYLITQRQKKAVLPGLWEFPGGKAGRDESDEQALRREVNERLCVEVEVGRRLARKTHDYEGYSVDLNLYSATVVSGSPRVGNIEKFKWVKSAELEDHDFPPADQATMDALLGISDDKD